MDWIAEHIVVVGLGLREEQKSNQRLNGSGKQLKKVSLHCNRLDKRTQSILAGSGPLCRSSAARLDTKYT